MRPQRAHPIHYFLLSFLNDRSNCHRASVLIRVFTASNLIIINKFSYISRIDFTSIYHESRTRSRESWKESRRKRLKYSRSFEFKFTRFNKPHDKDFPLSPRRRGKIVPSIQFRELWWQRVASAAWDFDGEISLFF